MSDALAGVIVGGLLGVLGTVLGQVLAGRHARQLASDEREDRRAAELREHRRADYERCSEIMIHLRARARDQESQVAVTGDELASMMRSVHLYGSDELIEEVRHIGELLAVEGEERDNEELDRVCSRAIDLIREELTGIPAPEGDDQRPT